QQLQQHERGLLQHIQGMQSRKKAALQTPAGHVLSEQQQLHALLGLRVPVEVARGSASAAAAAAAAAAAKTRALAEQTREFVTEQQDLLVQQPPQQYCDLLLQQQRLEGDAADGSTAADSHECSQTQDAQQRSLQHEAALRDYLAMASPVRGTRLAADVHAFAQLLQVAIDSLALLWRRSAFPEAQEHQHLHHQQVFLEELDGADVHYRQALAEPLLRAIHEKAGPILGVRPYR
ncbi:uncharacterized protein LOC34618501, partial [Cyclospora cayetanensis]|uniref:Uncharacterized protein LOC34618501 n=1 Tax=Cyclospora cayetanensis TaxID=88456 RepID=A0A6P6RXA6_9EIME